MFLFILDSIMYVVMIFQHIRFIFFHYLKAVFFKVTCVLISVTSRCSIVIYILCCLSSYLVYVTKILTDPVVHFKRTAP